LGSPPEVIAWFDVSSAIRGVGGVGGADLCV